MIWPQSHLWSFQVVRAMGEARFGGGEMGEIVRVAGRITYGDTESWYREWRSVAERNERLAREADARDNRVTARDAHLRAANYYRMADFFMPAVDPRKRPNYENGAAAFRAALKDLPLAAEPVELAFADGGGTLTGYFFPARSSAEPAPAVVFFGGADSTAEELYFTGVLGLVERGIACLVVDGPGQGRTLRIKGIPSRPDYEVPAAAAIDYLQIRPEVRPDRIGLIAYSMGGYYALRAAAFEDRIRAVIAWGGLYDYHEVWSGRGPDHPMAHHFTWLMGARDFEDALERSRAYTLRGVLAKISCPALVTHGEEDGVIPLSHAQRTFEGLTGDKHLKVFAREEGGSAHCQYDHLPLAHGYMFDWLRTKL